MCSRKWLIPASLSDSYREPTLNMIAIVTEGRSASSVETTLAPVGASPGLKEGVRPAQDALDDGLSAEAVAAALYRVRAELDAGGAQGVSPPPPPSPSR